MTERAVVHAFEIGNGIASNLHFDAANSSLHPFSELLCELRVGVGSEPSTAVNGHGVANHASHENDQGDAQDLGFEIPKRNVESGDRHGRYASATEIANAPDHRPPAGIGVERVLALQEKRERVANEFGRSEVGVGVTDACFSACIYLNEYKGGAVPLEGSVGLREIGGDREGVNSDVLNLDCVGGALSGKIHFRCPQK
jgi:hypothetical protein